MSIQSNPHHLVLGELKDYLTGEILPDTYDERYRQKIAKRLVHECGYKKSDILNNIVFEVKAGEKNAKIKVDFLVKFRNKIVVLIKFGPGSIVSRRLPALALSRIIKSYQIPIVVVTNGEDAEVLDGYSGKVIAAGVDNLPHFDEIKTDGDFFLFEPIKQSVFDQASRIVYACEVDGACECDTDICILK